MDASVFGLQESQRSRQKSREVQSTNSRKGKSPDSSGIRAEDIEACDDETREMVRQIFNEIIKQNEITPEVWKKVKIKVIHKKEMWKMLKTTARTQTIHDNIGQQIIYASTKNKRKIRRDSEAHTKQ